MNGSKLVLAVPRLWCWRIGGIGQNQSFDEVHCPFVRMVTVCKVSSGHGNHRDQLVNEILRLKYNMGRAVSRGFQAI